MNEHAPALKHYRRLITGYGKKGSGEQSAVETKDSLRSRQLATVIDLLSEGPIKGLVPDSKGNIANGVYLDGVQLYQNSAFSFANVTLAQRIGSPTQSIIPGFKGIETEVAVGVQLKYANKPANIVIRDITNTDVDRCRVTVSVPQLQVVDKKTGKIDGTLLAFNLYVANNGGGFALAGNLGISGKSSSNYQRAWVTVLPRPGPWQIRIDRITPDSTGQEVMNDLFWDSFTEIIDDKINYSNSAIVGIKIDAEQFRSIPKRVYDVEGMIIRVPTNYDSEAATYDGVWNGSFKTAYSNNPAWCFYDLVTNNRYGLGDFISTAYVDKWALYAIGVWCDKRVKAKPGAPGGNERRYECNFRITNQQEAFDLLAQMASIFRGWALWSGGLMVTGCDMPEDVSQQFTNANVLDGVFNYSSSDIREKHTQVAVAWNDPAQLGQTRLAIVDEPSALSRYGIQRADVIAYGCTRESEAIRAGKWVLYTEQYEDEQINFKVGHVGAYTRPGAILAVMDATISGRRRGGRVGPGTNKDTVIFDAPVYMEVGKTYYLSCIVGASATIQTRSVYVGATVNAGGVSPATPFTADPLADSVWVMTTETLEATLWRCTGKRQLDRDTYEINGVRHFPEKWDYVEKNLPFDEPDVSDIVARPPSVVNLKIIEYLVALSTISVGVRVTLSWTSKAPTFEVYYRKSSTNENWQHVTTDKQALDLPADAGTWTFQVTPVSLLGIKGTTATLTYTVIGLTAPPSPPKNFRIVISDSVALFTWAPAPELDVIIGGHFELRHSVATTGATWNTSQTVIPSIPGSATSVEASYQSGTYFLRTFDSSGIPSATWATIISLEPDGRYVQWDRICEQPAWLGSKVYTEVMHPQEWLVLGQTGGLWDDQLTNIDTWVAPAVDVLPYPAGMPPPSRREGTYLFSNRFDAGAPFSIRLSADVLAFPFADPDEFIDSRLTYCDTWLDWDDIDASLDGQVTIMMRITMDDPLSPTARWDDWKVFMPGEHFGRGFEFMAVLSASAGQNIGVETLCILGDFKSKYDEGTDVPYSAIDTRVYFRIKFFNKPAVVVTGQLTMAEDRIEITAKTREYFDLRITMTSTGTNPIGARIFDWHAQGY